MHITSSTYQRVSAEALAGAEIVVLAVPAQSLRANLTGWCELLPDDALLVSLMKGVEHGTCERMSEVIGQVTGAGPERIGVITGPNLAREIAARQYSASVVACADEQAADRLQKANSLLSVSTSASSVVGPALSGLMVAAVGPGWAFVADAVSFAGSASFLLQMPSLGRARAGRRRFFAELAEGWREVASRSWAWSTLIGNALSNMAFAVFFVLGPLLAVQRLGGASGWGLVSSGFAVGSLLGGLVAYWVKARRPIAFGMAVSMLLALPAFVLAARLPLAVIVIAAVAATTGGIVLNNNWDTAIQQLIPNELLARFRSYDYLLAFVAMPVGYAVAGPLSSAFGADRVLLAAGGVMLVANLVPAVLPSVRAVIRHQDGTITGPPPRPRSVIST